MAMRIDQDLCTQCGACIDECPHEAIYEEDDGSIVIDPAKCIECEDQDPPEPRCVPACAFDAILKAE